MLCDKDICCWENICTESKTVEWRNGLRLAWIIFRYEAMPDLIYMLNTLVNSEGEILITGIQKDVAPLTKEEEEIYKKVEFDVEAFNQEVGAGKLRHNAHKVGWHLLSWKFIFGNDPTAPISYILLYI